MTSELSEDVKGRKDDAGKLRYDLLPWDVLEQVVKVLTFGAKKYDDNNWKFVPDAKTRYEAAMLRHFSSYKQGEYNDKETNLPHLAHALTCLMFRLWFDLEEKEKLHDYSNISETVMFKSCGSCVYGSDIGKTDVCRCEELCIGHNQYKKKE